MRQPFRAKPKSFLDAPRREWQFATFGWLLRSCGGFPRFIDTPLVLPIADHFPDRDLAGHAAAAALFRRARDHAGMADWPCVVEPEPTRHSTSVPASDRLRVIHYPPHLHDPQELVAHFAHELARYLVESNHGRLWAENAPGGGAVFHFSMPVMQAPARQFGSEVESAA